MNITFGEAEHLFEKGCYEEAFTAFANIAENSEYNLSLRSDAYNMMGVIISASSPYLSDSDDESGLLYFKISLQINPKNLVIYLFIYLFIISVVNPKAGNKYARTTRG
jgi:hypothetical protein